MVTQANSSFCQKCKGCQLHKPRKRKYGQLPPKNMRELTSWSTVHIDLIGPYTVTAQQNQPGSTTRTQEVELHLTYMTMLDQATGWFEIVEVPSFIVEDMKRKKFRKTMDKSSARISRLFDQTWLARYPRPRKIIFDNGSEFKKDFVPLLKDWAIKPTCTTIKIHNPIV